MSEPIPFEQALQELEDSVARLEAGDLKLDEALGVFEAGIRASRTCSQWLERTRKRVRVLTSDSDGEFHLAFLDDDQEDSDDAADSIAETPST